MDPRLIVLPLLLCLPFSWLWWQLSDPGTGPYHVLEFLVGFNGRSGVAPARHAGLIMALAALALAWRAPRSGWHWRSPWPWLVGALAWQGLGLLVWANPWFPGLVWYGERWGAFAVALAIVAWTTPRTATDPSAKLSAIAQARGDARDHTVQAVVLGGAIISLMSLLLQVPTDAGPLGGTLRVGFDAPFGNSNFNIGAAGPMLGVGYAWLILREADWKRALLPVAFLLSVAVGTAGSLKGLAAVAALGALGAVATAAASFARTDAGRPHPGFQALILGGSAALLMVGFGLFQGRITMSTGVGTATMLLAALVLRFAPRKGHAPWLTAFAILGIAGWTGFLLGAIPVEHIPRSMGQRIEIAKEALEAFVQQPLQGYGIGTSMKVLNWQDAAAENWLWVPGYAEHAHNEYLQMPVDGGIINVLFIAMGAALTVLPLWRRRDELPVAAFLVGWVGVAAHAALESHLHQPGVILCLGVMAGLTWHLCPPVGKEIRGAAPLTGLAGAVVGGFLLFMCAYDFFDGGNPTMIAKRTDNDVANLRQQLRDPSNLDRAETHGKIIKAYQDRVTRLGGEDQAILLLAIAKLEARDVDGAEADALTQLKRLATDGDTMHFLIRLRQMHEAKGETARVEAIDAVLKPAVVRARLARTRIPGVPEGTAPDHSGMRAQTRLDSAIRYLSPRLGLPPWDPPLVKP